MEFWFSEFHTPDVKHSIRVNKQLYSKQSDYQRIDIFETPEFGRVLTLDGNVMLTERDEFIYDEMIVHVPMAVHKEAKRYPCHRCRRRRCGAGADPLRPGRAHRPRGDGPPGRGSLPRLSARQRLPDGRPPGPHLLRERSEIHPPLRGGIRPHHRGLLRPLRPLRGPVHPASSTAAASTP